MIAKGERVRETAATPEIRVLTPNDIPRLLLSDPRQLNDRALRALVTAYPGRSVWAPETLEFVVMSPWRHRLEIAHALEVSAVRHRESLLTAAIGQCRAADAALVLLIEMDEIRKPSWYGRVGLEPIEQVITYEVSRENAATPRPTRLSLVAADARDPSVMAALVHLDHMAFPWLWWNSVAEFEAYRKTPGVQIYLARDQGQPIGYLGYTRYAGWGHIDRIAVAPGSQGRGYGRQLLAFAVDTLIQHGARRVALSTQRENRRSRRLYERAGFKRSPGFDYQLYGVALRPPAPGLAVP
jgi:ribosomal protein S18 acetylase RimI-like enzyme